MTRGIPSHPVLAAILALALLASFSAPAGAAPAATSGTTDSTAISQSIVVADGPGHRFGFSQASVLAQATAITKTIANVGGVAQPAGTTTATVSPGQSVTFQVAYTVAAGVTPQVVDFATTSGLLFTGGDNCVSGVGPVVGVVTPAGSNSFYCAPGAGSTTLAINFIVSSSATAGSTLTNQACLAAFNTLTGNCSTVTLTVGGGALTITKTASSATLGGLGGNPPGLAGGLGFGNPPGPIGGLGFGNPPGPIGGLGLGLDQLGQPLTYTITVTNTSSTTASGVTVTDTLPAGVAFVSATSTVGTCTGSTGTQTVTCTVGTLNAGGSATITIIVAALPAACGTTLSNTATATATGLTSVTSSAATTTVNCAPIIPPPNFPLLPPPPLEFIPPPPPPLLPPPPPAPMGATRMAGFPEVPVIPEADSLFLVVGGLVALGGLVGYRRLRRRDD